MGTMAVRTEGLSKRYGSVLALDGLDLEVAEGEVVGYLGPNGAGKTTTIRLLLGLIRPTAGRAEIFGLDCQRQVVEAHRHLAYVAGEASLWPSLTGAETLHLLGRVQGRVDDIYRGELIERFDLDPSKKVRAYSKGNRQKLILVAALMTRPELLVLDEPTSGLDPLMEQAFRHCVHEARERGQTIFLSSHILSEVEKICDTVAFMRAGHTVLQDEVESIKAQYRVYTVRFVAGHGVRDVKGITILRERSLDKDTWDVEVLADQEQARTALTDAGGTVLNVQSLPFDEIFLRFVEA